MERAGVHVVFGFLDLKTHCKVSLVVRQEGNVAAALRPPGHRQLQPHHGAALHRPRPVHRRRRHRRRRLGPVQPADRLFARASLAQAGRRPDRFAAPHDGIDRRADAAEPAKGCPSRIFAKTNALVDHRVIEALYRASQAGVPIDIVVRGICCLRPGMPGISENIRVRSIVDRFLEHSRIYVFGPDDECQIYLASADWMPRNFYRRVEVMFPIESPELKERILHEIMPAYLRDNVKARILQPDGTYVHLRPPEGGIAYRCQERLLALHPAISPVEARVTGNGDRCATRNCGSGIERSLRRRLDAEIADRQQTRKGIALRGECLGARLPCGR